ncbi:hypothetical protein QFZ68_001848 [Streptomyces sp. V1I6]|nr:hypothetical protein [Streptomyces sp. V1I6]
MTGPAGVPGSAPRVPGPAGRARAGPAVLGARPETPARAKRGQAGDPARAWAGGHARWPFPAFASPARARLRRPRCVLCRRPGPRPRRVPGRGRTRRRFPAPPSPTPRCRAPPAPVRAGYAGRQVAGAWGRCAGSFPAPSRAGSARTRTALRAVSSNAGRAKTPGTSSPAGGSASAGRTFPAPPAIEARGSEGRAPGTPRGARYGSGACPGSGRGGAGNSPPQAPPPTPPCPRHAQKAGPGVHSHPGPGPAVCRRLRALRAQARQLSSSSIRKPRIGDGACCIGCGACGRTGAIGWVIAGDICCWPPYDGPDGDGPWPPIVWLP